MRFRASPPRPRWAPACSLATGPSPIRPRPDRGGDGAMLLWIWLGMAAALPLAERLAISFVPIYLAVGAVAAAGASGTGAPPAAQLAIFCAFSAALLAPPRRVLLRVVRTPTRLPAGHGREL